MNTIFKPIDPKHKPFNVKAAYLHLRMYGFEAITPIASDTLMSCISYYAKRGTVIYIIIITPQIITIGYTTIEENVVSAIAGLYDAIVEIDESEES